MEKCSRPLFGTVNYVFNLKIHWVEVQSCCFACDIIRLFSVLFCVVTVVHEYDFRFLF
jgi:hypothetical protein